MNQKTRIISTVSFYHAFNDGAVAVVPILFPVLKTLFNLSYTQVGIITGSGLFITLITQLMIGRISDKKKRRFLLSIGIFLLSSSLFLLTQTNGFFTLLVLILFLRFGAGFFHPVGIGWISKTFKKQKIDWAMGVQSAFGDFGAFIAILTTLYIVEQTSWVAPFYIWSVGGIICLFIGLLLTRNIDEKNSNSSVEKPTKKHLQHIISEEKKILKKMKLLLPGFIVSGAAWGIIITYLPLLLNAKTDLSFSTIGLIVSIWIGIGAITCIFYGKISSQLGRKNVVILSYLIVALSSFILTNVSNIIILLGIMIILGISTFLTYPSLFSFVSDLTDEETEGKTFSYIFTFQLGGGTILLFLSGVTSDLWGIWTPFLTLGILSMLMAFVFLISRKSLIIKY